MHDRERVAIERLRREDVDGVVAIVSHGAAPAARCRLRRLVGDDLVFEQQAEQHGHEGRECGGIEPDRAPVVTAVALRERVRQLPGDAEADQHADAVRRERDQALRGALVARAGLRVREDLARDEEEVVADAVQRDAEDQHEHELAGVAVREQHVARGPGQHADQERQLHAEALQEERHEQHEPDLGHLTQRLDAGGVGDLDFRQKLVRVLIVERERDADQDRRGEEDQEVSIAQQRQRVEAERFAQAAAGAGFLRRRARQREAEDSEHERRDGRHRERVSQEPGGEARLRVPREHVADREPRDDPADGAPDADVAEVPSRVVHLPERDRVHERERRHVQDHVDRADTDRNSRTPWRSRARTSAPRRSSESRRAGARHSRTCRQ